jgi:hypothetical protein
MKPFHELTEDELIALTDEQVTFYIDFACAEAGVPLLPPTIPGNGPTPPKVPTINVYKVAGVSFTDVADAEKLQAFILTLLSRGDEKYLDGRWREPKYFQPKGDADTYTITTSTSMTEAQARAHLAALDAHEEAKNAHENATRKYREILEKRKSYAKDVHDAISEAHSKRYRRDELQALFDRYVELAGGDRMIAARFLERAKPEAREVLPDIFAGLSREDLAQTIMPASATVPTDDRDNAIW